jgi:tetratricopeptide (TPR) repeat protein
MAKRKPDTQEANDPNVSFSRTEQYFVENKKSLTIIFGAIILVLGGYFGYRKFYKEPRETKSREMIWKAQHLFDVKVGANEPDSFKLAKEGVDGYYGFEYITNEFDGTMAGELAQYSLGIILLNEGRFDEAIEHLEGVDVEDIMISTLAIGLAGDAYSELGDYDEAITKYKEAIENSDNEFTAPLYLKKAAVLYEETGDYSNALSMYEKIRDDYEGSAQGQDIDKLIARAKNK